MSGFTPFNPVRSGMALIPMMPHWRMIVISGADRLSFLQNLCTQDILPLQNPGAVWNCLLDRLGKVRFNFLTLSDGKNLYLTFESAAESDLSGELEKYHFSEDIEINTSPAKLWWLLGSQAESAVAALCENKPGWKAGNTAEIPLKESSSKIFAYALSYSGEQDYLCFDPTGNAPPPEQLFNSVSDLAIMDYQAGDFLRIQEGLPFFNDMNGQLFTDINQYSRFISETKGCYPGQEIVTRISQKGKSPRLLMGFKILSSSKIIYPPGTPLFSGEKNAGIILSQAHSPEENALVGLALFKEPWQEDGLQSDFIISGQTIRLEIRQLPAYTSPVRRAKAETFYLEGMNHYHHNNIEEAETCFNRALEVFPRYADAFEAKAVLEEKKGNLDKAIQVNKEFARLDPWSVMARANLSRLYMLKGWTEKAEEEQNKATQIHFQLAAKSKSGQKQEEALKAQAEKLQQEKKRKMEIFRQVLELDPDDETALLGLGKSLCESGNAHEGLKYLLHAAEKHPGYSALYPPLVKALVETGDLAAAENYLSSGLEITHKKGDMMPYKSLQLIQQMHFKKSGT